MSNRLYNIPKQNNDAKLTGWYKTTNNNQVALRVGNHNLELDGILRFNNNTFEGYDGNQWIALNANKGEKGDAGKNFNEIVKVSTSNNIDNKVKKTNKVEINVNNEAKPPDYNLEFKNIIPGKGIELHQNANTIMIQNTPQQYTNSVTDNSITNLKKKCRGDISIFKVAPNCQIKKGEAVQTIVINDKLFIKTINFNDEYLNMFNSGINMIGIALQDSNNGKECQICTKGICNVLINNDGPYNSSVSIKNNNLGIVSKKGGIMNISMKPLDSFIIAGYFLENGNIGSNGNMVLFYVEPRIHYF